MEGFPEILVDNGWHPICGHYFWNNNFGARLFCQELGFNDGKIVEKKILLDKETYWVGDAKNLTKTWRNVVEGVLWTQLVELAEEANVWKEKKLELELNVSKTFLMVRVRNEWVSQYKDIIHIATIVECFT